MTLKNTPLRTLCLVYAIAITVGICEYMARPGKPTPEIDIYGDPDCNFPQAVSRLYPSSAESEYALGRYFEAKAGRGFKAEQIQRDPELLRQFLTSLNADLETSARHYERAIALGLKSDENLYYNYALTLIRTQQPAAKIDRAIADWRKNFPYSSRRDLDERRKSIEQQLRNLPVASSVTSSAGDVSVRSQRPIPEKFSLFDSTKQISSAIDAQVGTQAPPQWKSNPGYVGSAACRECHLAEFESYRATPHSRALSNVRESDEPPDTQFDHQESGRRFRVMRSDGKLYHSESLLLDDGSEFPLTMMPVEHRVGSGNVARTYLAEIREGFFVESPVTWYESTQSWGMSPGFDKPVHKSFTRQVLENCFQCHSGQVETSRTNQMQMRIVESSIGCERCHGPGEQHVAARRAKQPLTGDPMVNPRHLARHLMESICQQCHLQGDIHIGGRNQRANEFRPGKNLEEYSTVYRLDSVNTSMTVVGHVEQLKSSACYRSSGTLTCVTCHDPHKPVQGNDRIGHFRAICLTCHSDQDCGAQKSNLETNAVDDCVHCHMPKSNTEVPHVAFTHHRIGIDLPRNSRPGNRRSTEELDQSFVVLSDLSTLEESDRERALTLARLQAFLLRGPEFDRSRLGSQWKLQIEGLLSRLSDLDTEAEFARLQFLLATGDLNAAQSVAVKLLDDDHLRSEEAAAIHQQIGDIAVRRGQFLLAKPHFMKLTQLRINGRDWFELGQLDATSGNMTTAQRDFEIARQLLPAELQIYSALLKISQFEKDQVHQEQLQREIVRLNHQRFGRKATESR